MSIVGFEPGGDNGRITLEFAYAALVAIRAAMSEV